ncbi:hypothetical protein N7510_006434 [Penicillium lagena]|uniref:uncharacterized protein n=1 Tax=Penicillium lagena TaxID=94218 RepID=UPI002541785B|nr:uncharacterized protein N7510_006434 [Penicillium lagena]KAJ5613240.1 hypothetical protein N7510_006434 [Penicillium lagena]
MGLNRDPSHWNISPIEKKFRIRIWWLVVIHDRWCSLAYGTPLQIHRAQYDVPFPTIGDLSSSDASTSQIAAASIFVALTSLTEVLSCYLEHVYSVSKDFTLEKSAAELEQHFSEWRESLSDDIRLLLLRGAHLHAPGAANFRLAYLSVELLLRRIQLDLDKSSSQSDEETVSPFYMQARRAAEDIVLFMQELDESLLNGFWIPVNAFSLTSSTTFLLRSALRMKTSNSRNGPLRMAKDMVDALHTYQQDFSWDLADHCLANCGDLVEKISSVEASGGDAWSPGFPVFSEYLDLDASVLDELFTGFPLEM